MAAQDSSSPAPVVSIVVPVYATEQYLPGCLRSILDQSFADFEVLLIDDCSPGDTAAVVAMAADGDPRVRVIRHDVNQGVLQARLTGGGAARGEFIAFVDSDDEVEPWFLENFITKAREHDADVVQCAFTVFDPDPSIVNRGGESHCLFGNEALHGLLAGKMSNCVWNKLVRTSVWRLATDDVPPSRAQFSDDLLCTFAVMRRCQRFVHVPELGYRYLPRSTSVTTATDAVSLTNNLGSLDSVYRIIRDWLTAESEPAHLVQTFFDREFLRVARDLLLRIEASPLEVVAGLPRTTDQLGLLGSVALVLTAAI